jgi:hypothetical protein
MILIIIENLLIQQNIDQLQIILLIQQRNDVDMEITVTSKFYFLFFSKINFCFFLEEVIENI